MFFSFFFVFFCFLPKCALDSGFERQSRKKKQKKKNLPPSESWVVFFGFFLVFVFLKCFLKCLFDLFDLFFFFFGNFIFSVFSSICWAVAFIKLAVLRIQTLQVQTFPLRIQWSLGWVNFSRHPTGLPGHDFMVDGLYRIFRQESLEEIASSMVGACLRKKLGDFNLNLHLPWLRAGKINLLPEKGPFWKDVSSILSNVLFEGAVFCFVVGRLWFHELKAAVLQFSSKLDNGFYLWRDDKDDIERGRESKDKFKCQKF